MKNNLTVVKLGGNCMDDPALVHEFLEQFAGINGRKILVHGGGKMATSLGMKLGIEPNMIDGRRVTDNATIDLVTMVYAGLLNKKIVAHLQSLGCNSVGLSGADGNLIRSSKRHAKPVDYGFVGDPESVNDNLLYELLERNYVPVIAPVTHDAHGQLLNTNADTIASVISSALSAMYSVHLLFAFEKNGVLRDPDDEKSVIAELTHASFNQLRASGKIHSGMLPKLTAGFTALEHNVKQVRIANLKNLEQQQPSTMLVP